MLAGAAGVRSDALLQLGAGVVGLLCVRYAFRFLKARRDAAARYGIGDAIDAASVRALHSAAGSGAATTGGGGTAAAAAADGSASAASSCRSSAAESGRYPRTHRDRESASALFGVRVEDPYRWLEDREEGGTRRQKWIEEQNACTQEYFETHLRGLQDKFSQAMQASYEYDKYGCPRRRGNWFIFSKKQGLQNQFVMYKSRCRPATDNADADDDGSSSKMLDVNDGDAEVLLDVNALREDGTAALSGVWPSDDGRFIAYGLSFSGSDWFEIHVRNVETCKEMDVVHWCKFTHAVWMKDGSGFFYARYDPPSTSGEDDGAGTEQDAASAQKLCFHKLGTSEDDDIVVYESPANPKWMFGATVCDEGNWLIVTTHRDCDPVNLVFLFDMSRFDGSDPETLGLCIPLVREFKSGYYYITNRGQEFYFYTNNGAPRYRVIKMTLPDADTMRNEVLSREELDRVARDFDVVVPEHPETAVLNDVECLGDNCLALTYLVDVHSEVFVCDLEAGLDQSTRVNLPNLVSVHLVRGFQEHNDVFIQFSGFTHAGTVLHGHVRRDRNTGVPRLDTDVCIESDVPGILPEDYVTQQVFYHSLDGTRVPMFIVRAAKDVTESQQPRSTFLYGYGGFRIPIAPSFVLHALLFCKHFGGTFCIANIRGGGEYGDDWHKAGTKLLKQNVFDDFISAAEYLVKEGYTTPEQLAINGGSNGGLLVAACANQRPDLFRVAVPQVGVLDMLRFHKFTIGYAWTSDYGCAESSREECKALLAYSPVHNVPGARMYRPGDLSLYFTDPSGATDVQYPATLVTTADHDDRVVPLHSYKYIATLQAGPGSKKHQRNPLLIRIETRAGHGAGKPTTKIIEEKADVFAFVAHNTCATWRDDLHDEAEISQWDALAEAVEKEMDRKTKQSS